MRTPLLLFGIGVMVSIAGFVLAVSFPPTDARRLRSEVLASEKLLSVSPTADAKMLVLAEEVSLSASPMWQSRNDSLIDQVLTVYSWETYHESWVFSPYTYYTAKDFAVAGTATEQSSPQQPFNLYVLDSENVELWRTEQSYTACYETHGKTSASFDFSITAEEELPDRFYFVVEEHTAGAKPTVHVSSTIEWIEKSGRYSHTDYCWTYGPYIGEEARDFALNGSVIGSGDSQCNFCIMDSANYYGWYDEEPYVAYCEIQDVSTTTFSVPLTSDQASSSICFAIENLGLDTNETVNLSASLSWIEESAIDERSECFISVKMRYASIGDTATDFTLRGSATELDGNKFNFYIFDSDNYSDWRRGETYSAYYEVVNVTANSFSIPLAADEATSTLDFVAENPLRNVNETVQLSATLEWNEEATIIETAGGQILGGIIAFLGFLVMNIAGVKKGIRVCMLILGILSAAGGFLLIGLAAFLVIATWVRPFIEWPNKALAYFVLILAGSALLGGIWLVGYTRKLFQRIRHGKTSD